ncbi:MFS transporter [Streptomyces antnestii]|uniref:MFS transporter n=1 Tax=Streptomyces antnestii TaxID=2494256 RepID=A0A3S2VHQ6_9ACTN|nr:MFS transporter [Streptomyces sp. San01]
MQKAEPAPATATRTGAWSVTVLLALFMLLNYADKAVIGFSAQDILKDLGISAQQFGVIQSAFFWLFFAGAILLGALSGKIGLRWLLGGLMVVWVATMLPLVGTVSFTVLMLCRLVLGFAEGPAFALANQAVQSRFPAEKRALPAGIVSAGASLGPVVMAPILTWVIVKWSWHAASRASPAGPGSSWNAPISMPAPSLATRQTPATYPSTSTVGSTSPFTRVTCLRYAGGMTRPRSTYARSVLSHMGRRRGGAATSSAGVVPSSTS